MKCIIHFIYYIHLGLSEINNICIVQPYLIPKVSALFATYIFIKFIIVYR